MSYILEALKKSEQERRRGEMPEINRFETTVDEDNKKIVIWPVVAVVLVLVNIGLLFIWAPWEQEKESQASVAAAGSVTQESVGQQAEPGIKVSPIDKPLLSEPRPKTQTVSKAPQAQPKVKSQAAPQPEPVVAEKPIVITPDRNREVPASSAVPHTSYLPQIQELPASIQQRIPDMSFSSHMYSSEPRFRSIIINGRRLKEGQYLNDEIQVREITDKGVILSLGDTIFEVDVLGQWVN